LELNVPFYEFGPFPVPRLEPIAVRMIEAESQATGELIDPSPIGAILDIWIKCLRPDRLESASLSLSLVEILQPVDAFLAKVKAAI
jgi:hypothetical protein